MLVKTLLIYLFIGASSLNLGLSTICINAVSAMVHLVEAQYGYFMINKLNKINKKGSGCYFVTNIKVKFNSEIKSLKF